MFLFSRMRHAPWSRSRRWAASATRFARAAAAPPPQIADVALPPATPSEADAKRLLASCGIPVAEEFATADADAAAAAVRQDRLPRRHEDPVPDIQHKTEIGGVVLGVADAVAVRANLRSSDGAGAQGASVGLASKA